MYLTFMGKLTGAPPHAWQQCEDRPITIAFAHPIPLITFPQLQFTKPFVARF